MTTAGVGARQGGTVWYARPAGGDEYAFSTPFAAHTKLEALGVAGDIERFDAQTKRRDVVATRMTNGTWVDPSE